MNEVKLTGKIEQMIYDPAKHREDYAILNIKSHGTRGGEVMLYFPDECYYQRDILGKNMSVEGHLTTDMHKDMHVTVTKIVPCNHEMEPFGDRKPKWWKGKW